VISWFQCSLSKFNLYRYTTVQHYNGLFHALYTIAKDEGPRGLYRGLPPTLVGVGPNLAINFAAYETFRKLASEHDTGIPSSLISLVCGSSAAVVSATATYPLDLVRRRLQMRCAKDRGQGFVQVLRGIWASEGLAGFYRGIIPEYAKVVPGVSITYASYELMKRSIGVDTGRL
jgi:solute carrier family 25 phosphate transporter 23/24/25/41